MRCCHRAERAASAAVANAVALARAREYVARATTVCGDELVACWLHGGSTFDDHSTASADVDVCVAVRARVREQGERLMTAAIELNVDGLFVLAEDMSRADRPEHAFHPGRPLVGWAV